MVVNIQLQQWNYDCDIKITYQSLYDYKDSYPLRSSFSNIPSPSRRTYFYKIQVPTRIYGIDYQQIVHRVAIIWIYQKHFIESK